MLFSLYLGLAFISFLWTGAADQSIVEGLSWGELNRSAKEVENWLGLTGALLSHLLVYRWFGIASLALAPLLGYVGWMFWRSKPVRKIGITLRNTLFGMLWVSVLLGYLTAKLSDLDTLAFACGRVGYTIAAFLDSLIGLGTLFLLALLAFGYVLFFIQPDLLKKIQWQQPNASPETFTPPSREEPETQKPEPSRNEVTPATKAPAEQETAVRSEEGLFATPPEQEKEGQPVTKPAKKEKTASERFKSLFESKKKTPEADEKRDTASPEVEKEERTEVSEKTENSPEEEEEKAVPLFGETDTVEDAEEEIPPHEPDFTVDTSVKDGRDLGAQFEQDSPGDHYEEETDEEVVNPLQELPFYSIPPMHLLEEHDQGGVRVDPSELQTNKDKIVGTLANFKIGVDAIKAEVGPTVTLYEIIPSQGVKISQIRNLEDDIALNLAALGIRIIAPMPGRGTIGIEVPNKDRETVSLRALIKSKVFQETKKDLPVVLGKTISNEVFITDLAKMPHLLIGGATGQGKSVGINVLLTSLLYKKHPGELKIVLIDPKKVEFSLYNKLEKHFIAHLPDSSEPVITESDEAIRVLNALCVEMDKRYTLLKRAQCRQVKEYNNKIISGKIGAEDGHRYLPYIVIVIDELADLMITVGKSIEKPIARLAQMARAVGMHMVVATQRPSVNVLTGVIKANFPARMAFRVTSKVDSRVVLDMGGAEQLVGRGDMLLSNGSDVIRLQCAFIDTDEVENICDFISKQEGYSKRFYLPEWGGLLEAEEGEEEKKRGKS